MSTTEEDELEITKASTIAIQGYSRLLIYQIPLLNLRESCYYLA